jgi:rod shape-determining protein MreD
VFLIGLMMDLLGYLPLGVGVFTLLAVQGVALASRRSLSHAGFAWIWFIFCGVASVASLTIWLLVMLLTFHLLSPYPTVFVAILGIAIFPLLGVPFARAQRPIDPDQA